MFRVSLFTYSTVSAAPAFHSSLVAPVHVEPGGVPAVHQHLVEGGAAPAHRVPVEVHDYPGFVANRVLMPMINEAIFCVMEGVATPESIDTVMKLGMAHPMGPLALADFIGLDVCLAILDVLHRGLGDDKYRPCPLLRRMVAAGQLGRKTGRGFYSYDSGKGTG